MKNSCYRQAKLSPKDYLIVGMFTQKYSTHSQENKKEHHCYGKHHLNDVFSAEDGIEFLNCPDFVILVEINR